MKDREVIETLNDMKGVFGERGHNQYSLYSIDRAIAAIEKQIPKKLIIKPFHDIMEQQTCYEVNCVCGQNYMILEYKNDKNKGERFKDFSETFEYCYECGQKLNWD